MSEVNKGTTLPALGPRDSELDTLSRLAVDSLPSGVLVVRSDGTIAVVNRELERQFSYTRAELIGRPVEMLLPEGLRLALESHGAESLSSSETTAAGDNTHSGRTPSRRHSISCRNCVEPDSERARILGTRRGRRHHRAEGDRTVEQPADRGPDRVRAARFRFVGAIHQPPSRSRERCDSRRASGDRRRARSRSLQLLQGPSRRPADRSGGLGANGFPARARAAQGRGVKPLVPRDHACGANDVLLEPGRDPQPDRSGDLSVVTAFFLAQPSLSQSKVSSSGPSASI